MAFVITDGPLKTGQISAESTCFHSGQRVHMILSLSAQQMLRRWKKAENYRSDPCKITTSHYTWLGFRKHPLVRPQQRPGKVDRAGIISILTVRHISHGWVGTDRGLRPRDMAYLGKMILLGCVLTCPHGCDLSGRGIKLLSSLHSLPAFNMCLSLL